MQPFAFATATEILFGRGQAAMAAGRVAALGRRVLLVHGRDPGRSAALARDLAAAGCSVATFAVPHEPDIALIEAGVRTGAEVQVVVAMGTNLGRRVATLRTALDSLRALEGFEVTQVSPLVETDPVGGVVQPDYLNAVVVGVTRLAPGHLIRELHRIEADHGRVRGERWGARTLDLDVVTLGEAGRGDEIVLADERDGVQAGAADASWSPLALPHPRAHERAFVLVPWAQAAPWMAVRTPDGVLPLLDAVQRVDASGVRRGPSWDDDDHIDLEEGLT